MAQIHIYLMFFFLFHSIFSDNYMYTSPWFLDPSTIDSSNFLVTGRAEPEPEDSVAAEPKAGDGDGGDSHTSSYE